MVCWTHIRGRLIIALALLSGAIQTAAFPSVFSHLTGLLEFARHPKAPQYPDSFEVSYTFTLPYEQQYLPDGLSFPVQVWRDAATRRVRMDTYNGVNSLISNEEYSLEISPQVDELKCAKTKADPGEPGLFSVSILPDVSGWKYVGTDAFRDIQANVWKYAKRHGDKHTVYKFYAAKDGSPLRLQMHGNDVFSGAHFDIYVADYSGFRPGAQDSSVFTPPKICKSVVEQPPGHLRSFPERLKALVPVIPYDVNVQYERLLRLQGRAPAAEAERKRRAQVIQNNADLVGAHNQAPNKSFKLDLNRFADWSQEEFEAIMLPRHKEKRGLVARRKTSANLPYERLVPKGRLPRSVDWRASLADLVVKDQAACGSCWAFATTGVLEAAHYLATGKQKLFSEQQSMDCSWGYGLNKACDGGDYDAAMDYLKLAGGLVEEKKYEYLGADGFCRTKNFTTNDLIPFEGYAYIPPGDDEALMEAVYSRGPIAVSLDASQPSFRFYSEGILDEPNCKWRSEDLDHAVMLVGYGTCPETGKDYWLIRNSWSTYWGDKGYVKIARANHGCGISTDPVYAVFSSSN